MDMRTPEEIQDVLAIARKYTQNELAAKLFDMVSEYKELQSQLKETQAKLDKAEEALEFVMSDPAMFGTCLHYHREVKKSTAKALKEIKEKE